ncbi:hypothetical protein QF001_001503 [Paraburkholderia youngii]|uniref:beta strand repeat-containing protein n=1 Tax=Paraburkholderia youngii TaxID=2782701 RepID=UPI003D24F91A
MAAAQYYEEVQQAYLAYYGRPADPAGQEYWAMRLDNAGGNLSSIINEFGTSTESTALYGGSNLAAQITAIYQTLFGRAPDAEGLNFYQHGINTGEFTLASVALNIYYGATGTDKAQLDAKQAYADAFTNALSASVSAQIAYSGKTASDNARAAVAAVTDTASEGTAAAHLESTLANINAGAVGQTVTLTTGVDSVTLTGNNNVVNGVLDARAPANTLTSSATLTALDSIKGTGTGNTLNLVDSDNTGAAVAESLPTGITVSGIATVNLSTVNAVGTVATPFDVSGFTGLQNFNVATSTGADVINAATTTSVSVTDTAGAVTVTGGNAVTVNTTGAVTISGATGAISVTDKAVAGAANTLSIQGGTTVNVTATAAGNDVVKIGAAPTLNGAGAAGTALSTASAAAEPTGNVTVNESTLTAATGVTSFGAGAATIYTNGATSVSVTGTSGGSIADVETTLNGVATAPLGTSTLASVTLDGVTGPTAIKSNALTSLTIEDDDSNTDAANTAAVTVTNANAHALALTVGANLVTGTGANAPTVEYANVTDATATSVTVSTVGSVAANVTVDAATATSLTFNNAAKVTLSAASVAADVDLTTITASGSGALNLGDVSASAVKTINASGSTGGVTATISTSQVFQGGAGTNVITLDGALTKTSTGSITFGSGNNSLLAGTAASIASGVTVDGGSSGANTISASLVNAGNAADIKDFQILDVSGFGATNGNGALDASLMATAVSGISISTASTAGAATVQNLAATVSVTDSFNADNSSLVLTHAGTATNSLAVNFADATANGTHALTIQSTDDATVSVASGGAKGVVNTFGLTETDNHLTTLTITGSNAFTLGGLQTNHAAVAASATTTASALTTIDGSAATGALDITAGASLTVGNVTTTYTGLTIKGGVGGDTITNHAANGVIVEGATTAAHSNTLLVDGAGASINDAASAGADSLTLSGVNTSATLGSGTGVAVTVSANAALSNIDTVTFGTGTATITDNLAYGVASGNQTAATNGDMLTLSGTLHGNTLAFGAAIVNTGALGAATSVAAAQTFDQAVFLALGGTAGGAASTTTTLAANHVDWFQYGGNTYVVDSGAAAAGAGAAATANVVKIAGLVDLSHATVDGAGAGIHFA